MDALIYRTRDDTQDYRFLVARQPGGTFRIYIRQQPSYNGRLEGGSATHRHWHSRRHQFYIDLPFTPRSMEQALRGAKQWAESTERYRKYGMPF